MNIGHFAFRSAEESLFKITFTSKLVRIVRFRNHHTQISRYDITLFWVIFTGLLPLAKVAAGRRRAMSMVVVASYQVGHLKL